MEKSGSYFIHLRPKLAFPCQNKIITELIENIYYCKADDSYSQIFLESGKYHLTTYSLKNVEKALEPYHFIRCHRSFIVNINYIHELDKKKSRIILRNGCEIPISQTYRKKLVLALLQNCICIV